MGFEIVNSFFVFSSSDNGLVTTFLPINRRRLETTDSQVRKVVENVSRRSFCHSPDTGSLHLLTGQELSVRVIGRSLSSFGCCLETGSINGVR